MKRAIWIVALVACASTAMGAEQVYKWKDANGVTHFSDAPPPRETKDVSRVKVGSDRARASTDVEPTAPPAVAPPADPATPKPPEDPNAQLTPAARLALVCSEARKRSAALSASYPVAMMRDDKPVTLSDAEKKAELDKAQAEVSAYCK
jgi:Domain of unknown function (DUF4124)